MNFSLNLQECKYISLNIQKITLTYIIGHTLLDIHYWTYIIGHTLLDIHYWTYIIGHTLLDIHYWTYIIII